MEAAIIFRVVVSYSLCDKIFFIRCSAETLGPVENKSKLISSFSARSRKYKLIACKGDSSVACTFNRFIYLSFVVVVAACF